MSDETTNLESPRLKALERNADQWTSARARKASPDEATRTTVPWDLKRLADGTEPQLTKWELARLELEAKREKHREELRAAGVSCLECADTGRIYGQPCHHCERGTEAQAADDEAARLERVKTTEAWIASVDERVNIPPRYRRFTFDTYPNQQSRTLEAVKAWVTSQPDPHQAGLFLGGGFGKGKTGLTVSAVRARVIARANLEQGLFPTAEQEGWFVTATGMLESLRPGNDEAPILYGRTGYEYRGMTNLERYKSVKLLAIDDLGAERLTEWGVDRLFEIVNHRHNHLLPMIVTSNLEPDALADRINRQIGDQSGDRIVERLIESCTVVRFNAQEPNLRLEGAA